MDGVLGNGKKHQNKTVPGFYPAKYWNLIQLNLDKFYLMTVDGEQIWIRNEWNLFQQVLNLNFSYNHNVAIFRW